MSGPVMDLKQYTGTRYEDSVTACLNKEFDAYWEKPPSGGNRQKQLRTYLGQVQTRVVEAIALCSA